METVAEKTALLIEPGAPLFRYQQVAVASVLVAAARDSHLLNLSIAQIATLQLVGLRQHMRVGEIAAALGMQLPGASKLVADMVTRDLCTRLDDPNDRRAKVVTLTSAGRVLVDQMSRTLSTEFPASITEASPDVADIFNRIFAAMQAAGLTKTDKG